VDKTNIGVNNIKISGEIGNEKKLQNYKKLCKKFYDIGV